MSRTVCPLALLLPLCSSQYFDSYAPMYMPPQPYPAYPPAQAFPMGVMARPGAPPMQYPAAQYQPPPWMTARPAAPPMEARPEAQVVDFSRETQHVSELEDRLKELRQDSSVATEEIESTQDLINLLRKKIESKKQRVLVRGNPGDTLPSVASFVAASAPMQAVSPAEERTSLQTFEEILASASGDFKLIEKLIERRMKVEEDPSMAITLQKAVDYHRVIVNAFKKYANGEPCDNKAIKQAAERLKVLVRQEQDRYDNAVAKEGEVHKLKKMYCKVKKEKDKETAEKCKCPSSPFSPTPEPTVVPAKKCHTGVESMRPPMEAYISCQQSLQNLRDLITNKRRELAEMKSRRLDQNETLPAIKSASPPEVVPLKPPEIYPNPFPNRDGMPLVAQGTGMDAKGGMPARMMAGDETVESRTEMPEGNANDMDEKAMAWEKVTSDKDKEIEDLKTKLSEAESAKEALKSRLNPTPEARLPTPSPAEDVPCPTDEEFKKVAEDKEKDRKDVAQLKAEESTIQMLKTRLDFKISARSEDLKEKKKQREKETQSLSEQLAGQTNTWEQAINKEKADEEEKKKRGEDFLAAQVAKAAEKCPPKASEQ